MSPVWPELVMLCQELCAWGNISQSECWGSYREIVTFQSVLSQLQSAK